MPQAGACTVNHKEGEIMERHAFLDPILRGGGVSHTPFCSPLIARLYWRILLLRVSKEKNFNISKFGSCPTFVNKIFSN